MISLFFKIGRFSVLWRVWDYDINTDSKTPLELSFFWGNPWGKPIWRRKISWMHYGALIFESEKGAWKTQVPMEKVPQ